MVFKGDSLKLTKEVHKKARKGRTGLLHFANVQVTAWLETSQCMQKGWVSLCVAPVPTDWPDANGGAERRPLAGADVLVLVL